MKHLTLKHIDDIVLIRPKGSMDGLWGGEETDEFIQVLHRLNEEGARKLIVDLGEVNHLASQALGALLHTHKQFKDRDARFVLCHLSYRVQQAGAIVKLSICEQYEWLREAIAALQPKTDAA